MSQSFPGNRTGVFARSELGRAILARVTLVVAAALLPLLAALQYMLRVEFDMAALRWFAVIAFAVLFGVAILLHVMITRIMTPFTQLALAMNALASGRLNMPVPCQSRGDEIGAMARALETFRSGLNECERLQDALDAISERHELRHRRVERVMNDQYPRIETLIGDLSRFAGVVEKAGELPVSLRLDATDLVTKARSLREQLDRAFLALAHA